jgi:deoxyadenosine/deoxycytidine kinase
MRESALETRFVKECKANGWLCVKISGGRGATGWPDRLVALPNGRVAFVEFKAKGARLSPAQQSMMKKLQYLGQSALTLYPDSYDEVMLTLRHRAMVTFDAALAYAYLPGALRELTVFARPVSSAGGIIVVEGGIGVGKSTLCHELAKCSNVVLHEELDGYTTEVVNDYYAKRITPLEAQLRILRHRVEQYSKVQPALDGKWHVFDRSMWGDCVLAAANLHDDPVSWYEYEREFDELIRDVKIPTLQVYLVAEVDTCLERIRNRGRECELDTLLSLNGQRYVERIMAVGAQWHRETLSMFIPTLNLYMGGKAVSELSHLVNVVLRTAAHVPPAHRKLTEGLCVGTKKLLRDFAE